MCDRDLKAELKNSTRKATLIFFSLGLTIEELMDVAQWSLSLEGTEQRKHFNQSSAKNILDKAINNEPVTTVWGKTVFTPNFQTK